MNNKYVLEHDFGYGRIPELNELKRLKLRNINDLKAYVRDIITNQLNGIIKNDIVYFNRKARVKIIFKLN